MNRFPPLIFALLLLLALFLLPACAPRTTPAPTASAPEQSAAATLPPAADADAIDSPAPTATASPAPSPADTPKPSVLISVKPSPKPSVKPSATPKSTPSPLNTPQPAAGLPLKGLIIGIDAGHQTHANKGTEPNAPGSSTMKMKVTGGTAGRFTHVAEYEVNLQVALRLQKLLENAGVTVIMTRTKNDVNLTNIDRAQIFNKAKVDFGIRLHCNGSDDAAIHGAFILTPTKNPYLSDCKRAAKNVLSAFVKATGAKSLGITPRSDQTGFNWCERPIIGIEMGHMSNKEEDEKLASADYQDLMAKGIYNGIIEYFTQE